MCLVRVIDSKERLANLVSGCLLLKITADHRERVQSGQEHRILGVIQRDLSSGSSIYHRGILGQFSQPYSNSVSTSAKWEY